MIRHIVRSVDADMQASKTFRYCLSAMTSSFARSTSPASFQRGTPRAWSD